MKKFISVLLAALMVFSLAACSVSAKMPSKVVRSSDNKTLYTYSTSDSGKKITVKKVNSPVPKVWSYWEDIWNSHYAYPFFDMSNKKLMPIYALYEINFGYISDGIILAISPQVREGSIRSIDIPYTDYDGKTSITHYTFTVTKNKITVKGGDSKESIQFDKNGNVTNIDSSIKFIYKNNKLSKIDSKDIYIMKQTINSKGEVTYLQSPGVLYACDASYKYDQNGILKECDHSAGGGDSSGGHQLSNHRTYQIQNGVLTGMTITGKLDTHEVTDEISGEEVTHNYTLNLTEQYIYEN